MCVLFYSSFVCISAYANIYFKTTMMKTKHKNNTNCGSVFEPGASGLPYYCASICVRSWYNWRASSVDLKPKKISDIVKAKSSGEDPRATGGLVSNLPHPRVNKTKQHTENSNQKKKTLNNRLETKPKHKFKKKLKPHSLPHAYSFSVCLFP